MCNLNLLIAFLVLKESLFVILDGYLTISLLVNICRLLIGLAIILEHKQIQKVSSEGVQLIFSLMRGRKIQIPLLAGHQRPASETPFRWRADDGPTLNAGLVVI